MPGARYHTPSVKPNPHHNGVRRPLRTTQEPPFAGSSSDSRRYARASRTALRAVSETGTDAGSRCACAPGICLVVLTTKRVTSSPRERAASISSLEARRSLACQKGRSEEHTSELQSLMRISYAVFCLKKKQSHIVHYLHKRTE